MATTCNAKVSGTNEVLDNPSGILARLLELLLLVWMFEHVEVLPN